MKTPTKETTARLVLTIQGNDYLLHEKTDIETVIKIVEMLSDAKALHDLYIDGYVYYLKDGPDVSVGVKTRMEIVSKEEADTRQKEHWAKRDAERAAEKTAAAA